MLHRRRRHGEQHRTPAERDDRNPRRQELSDCVAGESIVDWTLNELNVDSPAVMNIFTIRRNDIKTKD